ncbi:MAG TPA: VCBS repeat-containing protein [Tepidisphaeraceae bacterium]|nr:VCBS repeat-containing protein [Tepidisphaeraceae bacterium]
MKRSSGKRARRRQALGEQSCRPLVDRLEPRAYLSVSFGGPNFYAGIAGAVSVASADFNGDGLPDLVVSGVSPSVSTVPVIAVYINSAGAFGTPTLLPFNGTPGSVAVGDFNNDGKADIAVVDSTDNQVILFVGDGRGNFTPGVGAGLAGQSGATSIAAADFNGDHVDDIAVVEPAQNQVEVQFDKGNGSFAAESLIGVPSPRKVIAADVNGDGHPDLLIAGGDGSMYVALNTGTGTFVTPVPYTLGTTLTSINDFAVADVNGDAQPDIVAVGDAGTPGATTGAAVVLLNQGGGSGTFASATPIATPIDPQDVVTGKFVGSSQVDLGLISAAGAFDLLPGNGDGSFAAAVPIFTTQLAPPLAQVIAGDFNGDGLSDIAFASPSQSSVGVALNTTTGSVTPPPPTPTVSPLTPVVTGKSPAGPLLAGGKIAPLHEVVTVTNSSAATISGAVTVNLVLATTAAGETGDPILATAGGNVAIKAHKSKTFSLSVKSLPAGVQGPYYLVAEITDPSKLTNVGASAATISVVAPAIDLAGAFVATPKAAKAGHSAGFTFSVVNDGTTLAAGALPIQIQASTTAGVTSASTVIDSLTKKISIKPGKTIRIHVSKVISATAGSYYVVVQLDPSNTLGDVNTANNTFATTSPIVVG